MNQLGRNAEEEMNVDTPTPSLFKATYPHLTTVTVENAKYTCVMCDSPTVNELKLGPLYYVDDRNIIAVHYFCLLFAAGLQQGGDDCDGMLGFMPGDIKKEVSRGKRLKCIYCRKWGATVGCCNKKCKASYHFPCGLENGINYQFLGNYESYCVNHKKIIPGLKKLPKGHPCPVCTFPILKDECLVSASCCKLAILHKDCVQQMALSAGYFFKCPTCNATDTFQKDMRRQGVFIPEQDASWELEPQAYEELLFQYSSCDAKVCECPEGRNYEGSEGGWLLARCRICGSSGTHQECGKLSSIDNWACMPCLEVDARAEKEKQNKAKMLPTVKLTKIENQPSTSATATALARAGTRVRNCSQGSSTQAQDKDDHRRVGNPNLLAQLHIAPECQDYFPHKRAKMIIFGQNGDIVPDWRGRELTVSMTDVFKHGFTDLLPSP